jgi:hypothetical protein
MAIKSSLVTMCTDSSPHVDPLRTRQHGIEPGNERKLDDGHAANEGVVDAEAEEHAGGIQQCLELRST